MLRIPNNWQTTEDYLIVMLFPRISPNESKALFSQKWEINGDQSTIPAPRPPSMSHRRALVELSVPENIISGLANRLYSIWPDWQHDTFPLTRNARDAAALRRILKEVGARDTDLMHGEPKAIFLHVGGLPNINSFRFIARTRRDKPSIKFYSFGTHECIPKRSWGVREIFSLGLVTSFYHLIR